MSGRLARETSDDDGYSSIGECETFFFRPQIRAGFFRDYPLSHRAQHGNYLKYVREHGVSSGLYYAMVHKAYGHRLHPKTLEKLVNFKWMQTDHLNSKLCDDPANFFLLFAPVNNFFSFEKLFHYKKEWSGDAYRAVVRFEHAAVELQYPSRFA